MRKWMYTMIWMYSVNVYEQYEVEYSHVYFRRYANYPLENDCGALYTRKYEC